jgi:N-sulfoglucosamine sulfohydrolase
MMTLERIATFALICLSLLQNPVAAAERPNVLIITVDDMNCDSVGAFGCKLANTTPSIDKFAAQGMRFHHAHVQVGNCFPSRNVLLSGRYPHNTGVEGFYQVPKPDYPHMVDVMKAAGYFTGIRGKATHSTPYHPYAWDADLTVIDGQRQDVKNAHSYYASTKLGIELAQAADKPFCLNVNISDPHKPFYAMGKQGDVVDDSNVPSRIFTPEEVPIPGFLFDHPDVRLELAHYYSSVRRADDCFSSILKALDESGNRGNTVIMFLSDHGMPLPFAKTALWNHSTRTPWIVYWPGVTSLGTVDTDHMISAVDLMPTLCDIIEVDHPKGFDGYSFAPILRGGKLPNREMVFKVYNENSGGNRSPMRSAQSKQFGYLFNPWSDGKRIFKTATTGTMTYRAMLKLAPTDEAIAARLRFFQHGVPEEFYDYENDPDALHNLIDNPKYASQITKHRAAMRDFMSHTNDPVLEVFNHRNDAAARSAYVDRVQAEADVRRKLKQKNRQSQARRRQNARLFQLVVPKQLVAGSELVVTIDHKLPAQLGNQQFHVTLKGPSGKRIERIVKSASGSGELQIRFKVPDDADLTAVSVSAFVGEDYSNNLLHRTEGPIAVSK